MLAAILDLTVMQYVTKMENGCILFLDPKNLGLDTEMIHLAHSLPSYIRYEVVAAILGAILDLTPFHQFFFPNKLICCKGDISE